MKKIFITYGDKNYEDQKVRICREAMATGQFDEVRAYGPEFEFSQNIRNYIDQYPRGGGFWLWKPVIIRDALQRADDGDIIVYADAGCSIYPHKDMDKYFSLILSKKSILLFRLHSRIKKWCSRKVYDTLAKEENPHWLSRRAVMGGVIMVKKGDGNMLIDRWAEVAETQPHLFADNTPEQDALEHDFFRGHRHDQSVLNVVYRELPKSEQKKICVQPERMERILATGQAFLATRKSEILNRHHEMKRKGWIASYFIRILNI
jgi:hypothetical protein